MRPIATACHTLLATTLVVLTAASQPGQPGQSGQFAFVLDDREAIRTLLRTAEDALAKNDVERAAQALLELLADAEDDVVSIGPELHIGVRRHARRLFATLPEEAVADARAARTNAANAVLRRAIATGDTAALWRCFSEYTCTDAAARALERLADQAIEIGDDGHAVGCFERYADAYAPERYPALPWARVLAKWAAAAQRNRDTASAARLRAIAGALAAANVAQEPVQIGDEAVALDAYLARLDASAATEPFAWSTFGGDATRARRPRFPDTAPSFAWIERDEYDNPLEDFGGEDSRPRNRGWSALQPPHAVLHGDTLYWYNGRILNAKRLADGRPVGTTAFLDDVPEDRTHLPELFRQVTTDGDALYVVREDNPDHTGQATPRVLVAFDATATDGAFAQRWLRGGENDPEPLLRNAYLTGSPVVAGGCVYVAGTVRTTDDRVYLFAFDAADGSLRWRRFLCAGAGAHRGPMFQRVIGDDWTADPVHGEIMIAERSGTLYVSTNLGVIAAVARGDGELMWLHRYPRRSRPQKPSLWPAVRPLPWQETTILVDGAFVTTTPRDSDALHVLRRRPDLDAGLVSTMRLPKTRVDAEFLYLAGVADRRLVLAERRWTADGHVFRMTALNAHDAGTEQAWVFEVPNVPRPESDPVEYFTGRALVCTDVVLVPTNLHVWVLDLADGRPRHRLALTPEMKKALAPRPRKTPDSSADPLIDGFGNLIPTPDGFASVLPRSVCVWRTGANAAAEKAPEKGAAKDASEP